MEAGRDNDGLPSLIFPRLQQFYKETIEFFFETRNECKTFWKKVFSPPFSKFKSWNCRRVSFGSPLSSSQIESPGKYSYFSHTLSPRKRRERTKKCSSGNMSRNGGNAETWWWLEREERMKRIRSLDEGKLLFCYPFFNYLVWRN